MEPGTDLDPNILIQVLQNKLAQAVIREAQLEAAVQGLMTQQNELMAQIPRDTEVKEDVSSAAQSE